VVRYTELVESSMVTELRSKLLGGVLVLVLIVARRLDLPVAGLVLICFGLGGG
jgi:hypothetical protein